MPCAEATVAEIPTAGWIPASATPTCLRHSKAGYAAALPLRRMGTPADIAHAVSYLTGEGAGFVTGQVLTVNGGNTY